MTEYPITPRRVIAWLLIGAVTTIILSGSVAGLATEQQLHAHTADSAIEQVTDGNQTGSSVSLHTSTADTGDATFTTGGYQMVEGERGRFTLQLDGLNNATITVGSDQVGYQTGIRVTDGNTDDRVTIEFDTATAGDGNTRNTFSVEDDADSIRILNRETTTADDQLDVGVYRLTATTPDGHQTGASGIAVIRRVTQSVSVHTLPSGAAPSTVEEVNSVSSNTSSVAASDKFAILIEATGFSDTFRGAKADDLRPGSSRSQTTGVTLTVEQANPNSNQQPSEFDIAEMTLLTNIPNGSYALVGNADDLPRDTTNTEFNINLTVTKESPYVQTAAEEAEQSGSTTLRVVPNSIHLSDYDPHETTVTIPTQSQYALTGTTTAAPGTTFDISIRSDESSIPYYITRDDSVTVNQTFSTTVNTSRLTVGDSLRIDIRDTARGDSVDAYDTRTGVIVAPRYNLSVDVTDETGTQITNPTYTINGKQSESLPALVSNTYNLTVSAPGYLSQTTTVSMNGSDRQIGVTLVPRPSTDNLTVTVVDENTNPISNATIRTDGQQYDPSNPIQLPTGDYTITASATGYNSTNQTVTVAGNTSLTLTLPPTHRGSGTQIMSEQSPDSTTESEPNSVSENSPPTEQPQTPVSPISTILVVLLLVVIVGGSVLIIPRP